MKPGRKVKAAFLTDSLFQYVLAHLQKYCPPSRPVVVRPSSFSRADTLGMCESHSDRFSILLNQAMSAAQATDVLIHEWAHALGWTFVHENGHYVLEDGTPAAYNGELHDAAWGVAYATVYREYLVAVQWHTQAQRMEAQQKKMKKAAKIKVKK